MVGFKWGRGGTLRAHISKRGKCRSFFNIKAKQPRKLKHYSTLDQKTQAISFILNAAERGGKDRAAAVKFQAARCDVVIKTVQKWMREFKAGLITVRKPTAGRPSKCTVEEQTRIEGLLEQNNYKITFRALAKLSKVSDKTLRRWSGKWGWKQKRTTPKPMLTAANIQKRLQWARKYRNKKFHKWVDVDEKWVSCYKPMGKFKIMPIMPRGMKCPQSRAKAQECEARTKSDVHHCHRSELD
jgi:transposase